MAERQALPRRRRGIGCSSPTTTAAMEKECRGTQAGRHWRSRAVISLSFSRERWEGIRAAADPVPGRQVATSAATTTAEAPTPKPTAQPASSLAPTP